MREGIARGWLDHCLQKKEVLLTISFGMGVGNVNFGALTTGRGLWRMDRTRLANDDDWLGLRGVVGSE